MKKVVASCMLGSLCLLMIAIVGCAGSAETDTAAKTDASEQGESHGAHTGHEKSGMDKMKEGLADLSEADRESAMQQHVCPVSDEMLGTMGTPIKVAVGASEVWICCDGCRKQLETDPDKFLAKLNAKE